MTITSCALFIAVDGKQQFHQVILEDEEKKEPSGTYQKWRTYAKK